MKSLILQLTLTSVVFGLVTASGSNSTCVTECGSKCCSETEECYNSIYGQRCRQKGKMVYCSDGLSYCIEPATCCGVMSCCPSDTACCGLNSCCATGAVCCGMTTCCPEGSTCCGFSTCCSSGSRCINGYCRAPWSSSMRWYYLVAVLIPFMFVLLYLAKRRQLRLAQQRGQIIRFGATGSRRENHSIPIPPPPTGYDPAPTLFEPPPYSEIANLPPEEKPPAYSELFNNNVSTQQDSATDHADAETGNHLPTVEESNINQDSCNAGNQTQDQSQVQNTTQNSNDGPKP